MTHSFQLRYEPLPNNEKNLRTGLIVFLTFFSLLLGYNTYQDSCTSVSDVERIPTGDTVDGFNLGTGDTLDGYLKGYTATDRYGNTSTGSRLTATDRYGNASTGSRIVNGEEEYLNSQDRVIEYNLPFSVINNSESQLETVTPINDTLK